MLRLVPDRETCDTLVECFLKTFNATHPVVDAEAFQAEVVAFWERRQANSTMWLALFTAVIAMGYQLPIISLPGGAPVPRGKARGRRLMALVQSIIFASSKWARRPSLIRIQLFLLLIFSHMLTLDWVDGSDIISGLLGQARRIAFTAGLHRDPSFAKHHSAPEIELRRKVSDVSPSHICLGG